MSEDLRRKELTIEWTENVFSELFNEFTSSSMDKIRPESSTENSQNQTEKKWKEGDLCMAPYADDNLWYSAKILNVLGKDCRVVYLEYDEIAVVNIDDLLAEDDVEHADEEPTTMECNQTVTEENTTAENELYRAPDTNESSSGPTPRLIPPPPALFSNIKKPNTESESLANMLMAWYMSGYHTGYYEGLKEGKRSTK